MCSTDIENLFVGMHHIYLEQSADIINVLKL